MGIMRPCCIKWHRKWMLVKDGNCQKIMDSKWAAIPWKNDTNARKITNKRKKKWHNAKAVKQHNWMSNKVGGRLIFQTLFVLCIVQLLTFGASGLNFIFCWLDNYYVQIKKFAVICRLNFHNRLNCLTMARSCLSAFVTYFPLDSYCFVVCIHILWFMSYLLIKKIK